MAYLSTYAANKILDVLCNNTSYTPPTVWYLALFTTNPDVDASGDEVSGGSYLRKLIGFGAAASGANSSDVAASFTGMPTATVTHWAVFDASSSGNMLFAGAFDNSIVCNSGDEVSVASGDIDLSFPGS
jgi:hypothetical protein